MKWKERQIFTYKQTTHFFSKNKQKKEEREKSFNSLFQLFWASLNFPKLSDSSTRKTKRRVECVMNVHLFVYSKMKEFNSICLLSLPSYFSPLHCHHHRRRLYIFVIFPLTNNTLFLSFSFLVFFTYFFLISLFVVLIRHWTFENKPPHIMLFVSSFS